MPSKQHLTQTDKWKIFKSQKGGFSLAIPKTKFLVTHTQQGGRVTSAFINLKKPIKSRQYETFMDAVDNYDQIHFDVHQRIKDENKDGVLFPADDGGLVVAIQPNQIKSATQNIGTFDPNNDDIRYSRGTSKDQITQFAQTGKIEQDLGLIEALKNDRTAEYLSGKKSSLKTTAFLFDI